MNIWDIWMEHLWDIWMIELEQDQNGNQPEIIGNEDFKQKERILGVCLGT